MKPGPAIVTAEVPGAPAPRPVFVIGKHRSGTTWLANQICRHPRVAGVQHHGHAGIIESLFFSHVYGRFGDLSHWANFAEMVEVLSASTYFRVAALEKAWLYSLWPVDYAGFFRQVMDAFARGRDAHVWVEKSPAHTLCLDLLARAYPDALFVGIVRSRESVLASALTRRRERATAADRTLLPAAVHETWSWYLYNRSLLDFARRNPRMHVVRYADMFEDIETAMRGVCRFVGIPFDAALVSSEYAPNTSFAGRPRTERLTAADRAAVTAAAAIFRLMPGPLLSYLRRRRRQPRRGTPFPEWFFSLAADAASPPARAG